MASGGQVLGSGSDYRDLRPVLPIPLLHLLLLRFQFLLLLLCVLLVVFRIGLLRVLLRLGLFGSMGGRRHGNRQTEKHKQCTSCNSLHTLTIKQVLTGFYNVRSVSEKRPSAPLKPGLLEWVFLIVVKKISSHRNDFSRTWCARSVEFSARSHSFAKGANEWGTRLL